MKEKRGFLLVANYDSAVGYAWWLMESYWAALAEEYHQSHNMCLAYPSISTLPNAIAAAPLTTYTINFCLTDATSVLQQLRFLITHRVKCIYFSDAASWHWRYVLFRLCGVKKIITHDHTPGLRTAPTGIKKLLKSAIQRLPLLTADALIGATEFVRLRHIYVLCAPAAKCYVASNGLAPLVATASIDIRARFNIAPQQKIMVMAARAHLYKGIDFALRCVAEVVHKRQRNDLHFLFCGDGPHRAQLEALHATLDIKAHVTFAGRCEDMDAIFQGCDFAIQPSHGEVGYSLSILEYMRAGLPTVVPDNPSVCGATQQGETGLIYKNGNITDAVSAIISLLDQKQLRDHMSAAARHASEQFTLAKGHAALINAVESVYAKPGRFAALNNKA